MKTNLKVLNSSVDNIVLDEFGDRSRLNERVAAYARTCDHHFLEIANALNSLDFLTVDRLGRGN